MDLGVGIAIASALVTGLGTFVIWRQTRISVLKDESDVLEKENERLRMENWQLQRRVDYLFGLVQGGMNGRGPKPERT